MSFLGGLIRNFNRVPETRDAEYDSYVERVQKFDASMKRIMNHSKPLIQHLEKVAIIFDVIVKELEEVSKIEYRGLPNASKPFDEIHAKETKQAFAELRSKIVDPLKHFDRIAVKAIQDSHSQYLKCDHSAKFRNNARMQFDRLRDRLQRVKESQQARIQKGGFVSPEEKLRAIEIEGEYEGAREDYLNLNQESKELWKKMLERKNDVAFMVFEGVSRMQRGLVSGMVHTVNVIDDSYERLVDRFQEEQNKAFTVPKITAKDFSELHDEVLVPIKTHLKGEGKNEEKRDSETKTRDSPDRPLLPAGGHIPSRKKN
ncbi:hypothetical protein AAMO2058_001654300, partial [Amorphochlora amoebiformis]